MDYLAATPTALQRLGLDNEAAMWDELFRLAIAAHLVYGIAFLHHHGVVYGDVSLKNAVFSTSSPGVLLVDCDATAALADPNRSQANSPGYSPPEMEPPGTNPFARGRSSWQDHHTDVFKIGVTLLKVLHGGKGAAQRTDPDEIANAVPAATYSAVKRSLDINPAARGAARDLYAVLVDDLTRSLQPPQVDSFDAYPDVLPRGSDVTLSWRASGAKMLRILGPNGFAMDVPETVDRWTITPQHSGVYTLVAANRGGESRTPSPQIELFDLPGFRLDLPGLAKVALPHDIPSLPIQQVPIPNVSALTASIAKATASVPDVTVPDLDELNRLYRVTESMTDLVTSTRPPILGSLSSAAPRAILDATVGESISLLDSELNNVSKVMDNARARLASIAHDEVSRAEQRLRDSVDSSARNQTP